MAKTGRGEVFGIVAGTFFFAPPLIREAAFVQKFWEIPKFMTSVDTIARTKWCRVFAFRIDFSHCGGPHVKTEIIFRIGTGLNIWPDFPKRSLSNDATSASHSGGPPLACAPGLFPSPSPQCELRVEIMAFDSSTQWHLTVLPD